MGQAPVGADRALVDGILGKRRRLWEYSSAGLMLSLACAPAAMGQAQTGPSATPAPTAERIPGDPKKPDPGPPVVEAAKEELDFAVSEFVIEYASPHPGLPELAGLLDRAKVSLVQTDGGYLAGTLGEAGMPRSLNELNAEIKGSEGKAKFSALAVTRVTEAVRDAIVAEGLIGVFVEVDPTDIEVQVGPPITRVDIREDKPTLSVKIYAAVVTRIRTVAAGERIKGDGKIDNAVHASIKADSPVQPKADGEEERKDLLRRAELDSYVLKLNRHPGRRVDVAISGEEKETTDIEPSAVVLDYLIRENNPLLLYFQVSNTGTEQTEKWRERFGLVHNQLTGNDDALSLDYVTGGFDKVHIFNGSYELPIFNRDLRLKLFGSYNQFDAAQVGRAAGSFNGSTYFFGSELSWNVLQFNETFVDLTGAIRYQNVSISNETNPVQPIRGKTGFLLPNFGVKVERFTDEAITNLGVNLEFNLPDVAGTDQSEVIRLGRLGAETEWTSLQWNLEQSFYLEPIFDRDRFLAGKSTLANEVAFAFKGQNTLGNLVAPNFQGVAGGLYSVRGYPESIVVGDTVYIVTGEYRLHLPRLFDVNATPGKLFGEDFRYVPSQQYGRPDWDLILKAFVDVGNVKSSGNSPLERDETIIGAGFGVEFLFKRYLNMRLEYGFALDEVRETGSSRNLINEGDGRIHFVTTLLF